MNIATASAGGRPARIQPVIRAVGALDPHLPLHLEALADHGRQVLEHLRQVAARLALGQHRGDEEPRVEQRDALAEVPQGLRQRACRSSGDRRAA